MKSNNLFKHFSIIGFGSLVSLALGFFNTPIITRLVSPVEYGQYSLFLAYGNVIVSIIYFGFDQAFIRYYYDIDRISYKHELLMKTISTPLLIYFIISFLLLINYKLIDYYFSFNIIYVLFLLSYTLIQIIYRFSSLVLRLEFKSKLYSTLEIIQKVFFLVVALTLIYFTGLKASYILMFSYIFAYFFTMAFSIFHGKEVWKLNSVDSVVSYKTLARYSIPFVFSIGVTSLFNANDKLFLEQYTTIEELGVYSSATSLMALLNIFQRTFNAVWAPASIEHYLNKPEDKEFYKNGNSIITVLMIFLALSIILVKDWIAFLLGTEYREAAFVLPMLIIGPVLFTISETTVGGIVFYERSKDHIYIAIIAFVFDIASKIILVPRMGAKGAAFSSALSYVIIFSLRTIIANKYFYVDYNLRKFYFFIFILFIYAYYNMFYSFNLFIFITYIALVILLYLFYRHTVNAMVKAAYSQIKRFIK